MATRRKRTKARRKLNAYKVYELLTGEVAGGVPPYYQGYGDPVSGDLEPTEDMRRDWEQNRDALMRFWNSGEYSTTEAYERAGLDIRAQPGLFIRGSDDVKPWAWRQVEE